MKKKLFLIVACLAFFARAGYAQDIITKQNGDAISAKVLEVSTESVRYKRFELLTGPDYILAASEVFRINYENGGRDIFENDPATGKVKIRHIATPAKPATTTPATPATTPATPAKPATTAPAKPATTSATTPATPVTKPASLFPSGARIKQSNNGTFTLLGFDGASLKFRAAVKTPIYMVSLVSGRQTVEAKGISNTKGDIVFDSGATAIEGSSLLLSKTGINMQRGTEARCTFEDAPAGFIAKTIVFLTAKNASPMTYDLAAGEWITPQQTTDAIQSSSRDIVEDTPAQLKPTMANEAPDKTPLKTVKTIKFQGGNCIFDKLDLNPRFAPAGISREKEKAFALALKYTLDAGIDNKALSILHNNGTFVEPNGKTFYKSGAALIKDNIYTLVVAVPKHVDVTTLKYVFEGQMLSLNKADNIPDKTAAELKVKTGNKETVYNLSLLKIGHNDNGKTEVTFIKNNGPVIMTIRDGKMIEHIRAKMLVDGNTMEPNTVAVLSNGFSFTFDTSATPTQITVYGCGDENSPPITFDAATKTVIN
ncbi:MAG: hypothetical protein LBD76_04815, partial [Prevotellaceae bacterium]|jgi:hypothetical protein|nr:hypothetical protein [Prevotellaceae bacterium]